MLGYDENGPVTFRGTSKEKKKKVFIQLNPEISFDWSEINQKTLSKSKGVLSAFGPII